MAGGSRDRLVPRWNVRLRPAPLDHKARHRGPEEPAMPEVEAPGQARVEPRAVRIPGAGDVDDASGFDRRDVVLSLRRENRAPLAASGHDDDVHPFEEIRGPLPSNEAEGPFHLRFVREENFRVAQEGV